MDDNALTDEEKLLFRRLMADVKPLKNNGSRLDTPPPSPPPIVKKHRHTLKTAEQKPQKNFRNLCLSSHYQEAVDSETVLSFKQPGTQSKDLYRLKTNETHWEAHLDLHGYKSDQAQEVLLNFLSEKINHGHRCVLIIHGKGGLHHEAPVLKNLVYHWLKQIPEVLALHSALPKHGGTGAIYVLLKK